MLLIATLSLGQSTSVTLQVTDLDSQTWNNGTWSVRLTSNASTGPFAILGTATLVPNQSQSGALSASGGATMTLTPNNSIGPLGTQWVFNVCSQARPAACFTFQATIQGASQNLTLTPPGIRISVVNPILVVSAYQDLEITGQSVGSVYYNLTILASRQWNGSSWVTNSGAGLSTIIDVRNFSGTDWCSQVNAADTSVLGTTAVIVVPSAMSGLPACTTSIFITANHKLQFDKGTFNLGTQNARAGITVGTAVNNVSIIGAGLGQSILQYTSFNTGSNNVFPNGSAIGIGTVTACTSAGSVNNYITISGLTIQDLNTGSALASAFNPSGVAGSCINFLTIEKSEFTDNKGNGGITANGQNGSFGGNTYYNRNNIFDGTTVGGGGEFTADNSSNWTHYQVVGNSFSNWPCAVGVARASYGLITNNVMDMSLKAPFSGCSALAIGAGSDTSGTLANVWAIGNVLVMGFSGIGIGLFPKSAINGTGQLGVLNNNIVLVSSSSITGISINGADATHIGPDFIIRNNTVSTDIPTSVSGRLNVLEFSNNSFTNIGGNIPMFNCTGTPTIISGGAVRVFGNRANGTTPVGIANNCTDSTFFSSAFQAKENTVNGVGPFDGLTVLTDGSFGSSQTSITAACETSFTTTTLSTGATTTDTGQNCLPANAVIDAVVYRITTTITTAANFTIGDATTAARFCSTQSTLTLGTTGTCFVQADQTGAAGPRQTTAAKVRVTTNVNPGAGAIRLVVYYHTWAGPTS